MSRDYEPQVGQWYEDLETEESFKVVAVDPDEELVRVQWPDREIQELDLDQWNEMDLELATAPEGWVDDEDFVDEEEDEDEEEFEDDDEDDWDEDDDDWDEDDDDLDEDDEYRDRE